MKLQTDEAEVLSRLVRSLGPLEVVRAIVLKSSRANPNAPRDILSDYDVDLFVSDTRPFTRSDHWLQGFGKPLLRVRDREGEFGVPRYICMVLYSDGTKIDYSIWPPTLFNRIRQKGRLTDDLDLGYRVILDKDDLTRELPSPTYTAHIPRKPTEKEFQALVEEFWFVATYVAKYLWRDELVPVKVILDYEMKFLPLRKLLTWRIESDHNWSVKPGFFGRGLEEYLDTETWRQFAETYVGSAREDNWRAQFQTIDLFRRVATGVAADLGYRYPHEIDIQMMDYLQQIKDLPGY